MTNPSKGTAWPCSEAVDDSPISTDRSWIALERFVQTLQTGVQMADSYQESLVAIQEATEAEVAFLCNDQSGEILAGVGLPFPPVQWCQQFTRTLARDLPSGGLWKSSSRGSSGSMVLPDPTVAIVLPIKNPRSTWLIAFRSGASPPLQPNSLRVARVIWQLQVNHQRNDRVHDKLKGNAVRDRAMSLGGHRRQGPLYLGP